MPGGAALASLRLAPRCSAPSASPCAPAAASAASAAFTPPRCSALLSTLALASRVGCRYGGLGSLHAAALLRARLASLGAIPGCAALAPLRLAPRWSAPSPSIRASAAASVAWAAFAPPRCAALASSRLAPRCSASSPSPRPSAAASGGLGGLCAAALLRAFLVLRGAALLSPVAFASYVGRRFGGFGGFRCAALASPRLAPRSSAPSPSPRASAAATTALAAFVLPHCAALAFASRIGFRFGGFGGFRLIAPRCSALSPSPSAMATALAASAALAAFAAPRPPRLAWCRAAQHHHLALHVGLRFGGCGGFCAAALRRACLASLGAALLGTITFASRANRRAARHHHLRLARRPPLRRLRRLSCCRAAPRSPRLAWRRAAQPLCLRLARRLPLRRFGRFSRRRTAPRLPSPNASAAA